MIDYTDKFVIRLAHAVADYREGQRGGKAAQLLQYIKGLTDAFCALGGPADCSIYMFAASDEVGPRPLSYSYNKERKEWEAQIVLAYRRLEPGAQKVEHDHVRAFDHATTALKEDGWKLDQIADQVYHGQGLKNLPQD